MLHSRDKVKKKKNLKQLKPECERRKCLRSDPTGQTSHFFQGKADTANKGENGKRAKEELRSTVGSDATTRHAC